MDAPGISFLVAKRGANCRVSEGDTLRRYSAPLPVKVAASAGGDGGTGG